MKKTSVYLLFISVSIFLSVQDIQSNNILKTDSLVEQTHNLVEAIKLIEKPEIKSELDKDSLAKLCFDLYQIFDKPEANVNDKSLFEDAIVKHSEDSVFQETYATLLLQADKDDDLFSFWNKLTIKYPDNKALYLWQKGRYYLLKDEYLQAEAMYEALFDIDKTNAYAYMDIGYYGMEYAEKIYNNGEDLSYSEADQDSPKNKKDALPYFIKSIKNMRKAYDLFSDEERCDTHVLVFLNDLCGSLIEDNVLTIKQLEKYFKGIDTSNYYCD